MATIRRREPHQFQAIVKRKGWPQLSHTSETRADAERWARKVADR